jgi:hypothetical protein
MRDIACAGQGAAGARSLVYVYALLWSGLLLGCGELGVERPRPQPFTPHQVAAQVALGTGPGFADQVGGGLFAGATGEAVRLRLDGTRGALESHPGNPAPPGRVSGVFRLGPRQALVAADNGLYVAESGWMMAPPWQQALGPGLTGTAESGEGVVWLAHASGLYRLAGGTLSALKADGEALAGVSAVAAAVTDGQPALWLVWREGLWVAAESAPGAYRVLPAGLPLREGERLQSLAALGASRAGQAEVWLLTSQRLLRQVAGVWREVALEPRPERLWGAGRFLWAQAGGALLQYDAESGQWGVAEGVDMSTAQVLAVDESGCMWVQTGTQAVALTRGPVPRMRGLLQGQQVVQDGLAVSALLPPGATPASLTFALDDMEVPAQGPLYSLGGLEADGALKPYSLAGLLPGMHTLSAVARFEDGSEARRVVAFDYQPASPAALSWSQDVRPIHQARCAQCHENGPGRPLNTYELWRGSLELVVSAVRDRRMPADGPLDPQQISLIQRWAASGARP